MPLTVDCYCPGDASVSVCELVELRFIAELTTEAGLAVLEFHETVGGGGLGISAAAGGGTASLDTVISGAPLASWIANWPTVNVTLFAQETGSHSDMVTVGTWKIIQHYECVDSLGHTEHVYRNAYSSDHAYTECVDGVLKQIIGSAGGASGSIFMVHTSPLGCTDVTLSVGNFQPDIDPPVVSPEGTPNHCLCVSGGSGNYSYTHVGALPDGQTLNVETGCIEGSPTGPPGASSITYRVTDLGTGDFAEVTCDYVPGCAGAGDEGFGNSFY